MNGSPQSTDGIHELTALPKDKLDSICRFLVEYSEDQGDKLELGGIVNAATAMESVRKYAKRFAKSTKGRGP